MERLTPLADYSPQWMQHAVDYILDNGMLDRDLSADSLRLLAVSLLICDDNGMFRPEDLQEALDDPTILNVADQILKKAAQ